MRHFCTPVYKLRAVLDAVTTDEVAQERAKSAGALIAVGNLIVSTIVGAKESPLFESDKLISEIGGSDESIESSSIYKFAESVYAMATYMIKSVQPIDVSESGLDK